MKELRVQKVLDKMKELQMEQLLITDPASVYYLTEHYEDPYERFWALLLHQKGTRILVANRLFSLPEVKDVELIWYSDGESGVEKLCHYIDKNAALGVDGTMRAGYLLELMKRQAAGDYVDASEVMKQVRACKDEAECKLMRKASAINDAAMEQFRTLVREGVSERDLADGMLAIYKKLGAEDYSFEPLVAFGANAASGHHGPDTTLLKKGDCVLFDVGCKKDGYCSDMTRTFFYGEPDEESRKVYETVLRAQLAAERAVRPGIALKELDKIAREVIAQAGYGEYFTHRLGHFIGMDVHESGDVSPASELIAEPGMIFSIEPGIYLPGKMGVRIEDLVLVTETGVELLNHYSKELTVL